MNAKSTLGARIRTERQRKGWTQEDLAAAMGATAESVARIEMGEMEPADVARVAAALGITIDRLAASAPSAAMTKRGVG